MLAFDAVLWIGLFSPLAVAAIGGGIALLVRALDRRNTEQHAENKAVLERIESKVDHVGSQIDEHIAWHAHTPSLPQIRTIVQKEVAKR